MITNLVNIVKQQENWHLQNLNRVHIETDNLASKRNMGHEFVLLKFLFKVGIFVRENLTISPIPPKQNGWEKLCKENFTISKNVSSSKAVKIRLSLFYLPQTCACFYISTMKERNFTNEIALQTHFILRGKYSLSCCCYRWKWEMNESHTVLQLEFLLETSQREVTKSKLEQSINLPNSESCLEFYYSHVEFNRSVSSIPN